MPDGERSVRRFAADAELEELYAFVECRQLGEEQEQEEEEEKEAQRPEAYEHVFGFQLVSPMPREVFGLDQGGTIRGRVGRSWNLIVEKIAEDGDDEEDEDGEDGRS